MTSTSGEAIIWGILAVALGLEPYSEVVAVCESVIIWLGTHQFGFSWESIEEEDVTVVITEDEDGAAVEIAGADVVTATLGNSEVTEADTAFSVVKATKTVVDIPLATETVLDTETILEVNGVLFACSVTITVEEDSCCGNEISLEITVVEVVSSDGKTIPG